ncbi:MAG: hypothetical protein Q7J44_16015 [Pseudotabrizicola sp.]|uniref:hypothetical protein n=1 Tax=Pseudotabrizicola sp. TaxID=2939647 RepID=UPI0027240A50|nr:hypothetical protein [Pseudotabrizicola sp.]MDO9640044.1 hypothetical protein [Pseudotabrizicola sp.]
MNNTFKISAALAALALSGCVSDGLTPYSGPDSVIATGVDKGRDSGVLRHGHAAIAYDPDGCQNWIMDDGVEGYSSPRFDPVSGLPVCNNHFPPGTVIRNYQTNSPGIRDYVPGPGIRTVVRRTN